MHVSPRLKKTKPTETEDPPRKQGHPPDRSFPLQSRQGVHQGRNKSLRIRRSCSLRLDLTIYHEHLHPHITYIFPNCNPSGPGVRSNPVIELTPNMYPIATTSIHIPFGIAFDFDQLGAIPHSLPSGTPQSANANSRLCRRLGTLGAESGR